MGSGGEFFKAGTAEISVNNDHGIATLNMLKSLVSYSNPDFLTFDSNATQALWESGDLAMATMWGTRGAAVLDDEGSTETVVSGTVLSGAPTWGGGSTPEQPFGGTALQLRQMQVMQMLKQAFKHS